MKKILILFCIASTFASLSYAKQYCHGFDAGYFCIEYPSYLGIEPAPTNGDGRTFYDRDGFRMSASCRYNVFNEKLDKLMQASKHEFDQIAYSFKKKSYYVLSGYKKNTLIYQKTFIAGNEVCTLYIEHPKILKKRYQEIIRKASKSFKLKS